MDNQNSRILMYTRIIQQYTGLSIVILFNMFYRHFETL